MMFLLLYFCRAVGRTSELARVFGIKFFNVLSRGSQFRVESMMLRLAKPQNYILTALSRKQVGAQPAMECLPLIMEPVSRVYNSPVVRFDLSLLSRGTWLTRAF